MGSAVQVGSHRVHAHEDAEGKWSVWVDTHQIGTYYESTDNVFLLDGNHCRALCINVGTLERLVEVLREIHT